MFESTGPATAFCILMVSAVIFTLPTGCTSGEVVSGTGTVNAIMAAEGKVNITHDPIPALDWPAMTMDFRLADSVQLEGIEVGSEVRFELHKAADGSYEIGSLRSTTE